MERERSPKSRGAKSYPKKLANATLVKENDSPFYSSLNSSKVEFGEKGGPCALHLSLTRPRHHGNTRERMLL